jgi:hypothetical protein
MGDRTFTGTRPILFENEVTKRPFFEDEDDDEDDYDRANARTVNRKPTANGELRTVNCER